MPPQTAAPVIERTFEVAARGRCRLRVPRASVTLEAGAGGTARVTLTPAPGTAPHAAQALADTLRVRYAEGVLRVEPERPPSLNVSDWRALREGAPVLHLRVQVPAGFGADVHASGGAIDARGLSGPVTLEATGGTLRAAGLTGRLDVQARRCRTTVEGFSGKKCTAQVHGGAFEVGDATAEGLDLESRAARLQFDDLDAALRLTAQGGSVEIAGLRGALHAEVCGGTCAFTPENGHAARLHAPGSSVRLKLANDFTATLHLSAQRLDLSSLDGFDGERTDRHAEGTLSGGGAPIEVTVPGGTLQCEGTRG